MKSFVLFVGLIGSGLSFIVIPIAGFTFALEISHLQHSRWHALIGLLTICATCVHAGLCVLFAMAMTALNSKAAPPPAARR
jgi:hypothetical protein